ncbi:MAG: hypothetical protein KGO81_06875 [Bacteroidota bacterium]|nr:hypothetical protein [Bacteroidota bacterium]
MRLSVPTLLLALSLLACNSKEKKFNERSYQEQKISLAEKEKQSPKTFLRLSGDDHKNLWGKTVYKGIIKNTATISSYKEIRVKLLYFKQGKEVANHEEFFDKPIAPNDEFSFKAKYKTPSGTDSVAAYIMRAKAGE